MHRETNIVEFKSKSLPFELDDFLKGFGKKNVNFIEGGAQVQDTDVFVQEF